MAFDHLSIELIAEIFRHLDRSACLQVSLCCRLARDVAEPCLYAEFVQRKKGDLGLFLRSLMEKPERAKYLRHFTGSMIASETYRLQEPGEFDLSAYLKEPSRRRWILDQLPKTIFWPSRINSWQVHVCSNLYWDPICAFILWICSENLRSITMDHYGLEIADAIIHLVQQVLTASKNPALPNPFPKLRRIELGNEETYGWSDLNAESSMLQLPSVKEFAATQFNTESIPGGLIFHTEIVTLKSVQIRTSHVKALLLCFHKLKRLEYIHTEKGRAQRFWPSSIRLGLQNSKHCVEELVVMNQGQRWSPIPAREEYLLCLGREFENLRLLDVSSRSLFGVEFDNTGSTPQMLYDMQWTERSYHTEYTLDYLSCQQFVSSLPPKLEDLIIRECTAAIYSFLGVLMFGNDGNIGSLKRLKIEFYPRFQLGEYIETRWYREALRRGIEVEVAESVLIQGTATIVIGP